MNVVPRKRKKRLGNHVYLNCSFFVLGVAILIRCSLGVQYSPLTNNNGLCAPGFEEKLGVCQACKPGYFKNSTMTGMSCRKCDDVKNQFEVEVCPCTSVRNSVIVCKDDNIMAPKVFCKKKSEVQESCIAQGGLQNPQHETSSSTALSDEFNRSDARDWSGSSRPPISFTTVAPDNDHRLYDAGIFSLTLYVIWSVAIIAVFVSAIAFGVCFYRRRAGMLEPDRKQPLDAARNAEQGAHLLPERGNEVHEPPVNLLLDEIEPNPEEPQSSGSSHLGPVSDDSRDFSYSLASLDTPVDVQLDFENSTAPHTNPVSDRHTVNFGVASVLH